MQTTCHSRANCGGFNESITWNLKASHYWRVVSFHHQNPQSPQATHIINTGTAFTWRQAAYHAFEAYSSRGDHWLVIGAHFYTWYGKEYYDTKTEAEDCAIYDGWWDY